MLCPTSVWVNNSYYSISQQIIAAPPDRVPCPPPPPRLHICSSPPSSRSLWPSVLPLLGRRSVGPPSCLNTKHELCTTFPRFFCHFCFPDKKWLHSINELDPVPKVRSLLLIFVGIAVENLAVLFLCVPVCGFRDGEEERKGRHRALYMREIFVAICLRGTRRCV